MTPRQIRMGLAAAAVIAVSTAANLLLMQPREMRSPRPDRPYRGLSELPGTPSTTIGAVGSVVRETTAVRVETPVANTNDDADANAADLIRVVQQALADRNYAPGNTSGSLDMVTRAAIMAFENDRGLILTGEPTLELLAELRSEAPNQRSGRVTGRQSEHAEAVVRAVQQSLSMLKYQPGVADGLVGDATANAIRAFGRDHGLRQSGRVSGRLVTRLSELAGRGQLASR